MNRQAYQAQAIQYGRDVVKRISVLMGESYSFDCLNVTELAEARQIIKGVISEWQKLHNEIYYPDNPNFDTRVYDSDYDEDKSSVNGIITSGDN